MKNNKKAKKVDENIKQCFYFELAPLLVMQHAPNFREMEKYEWYRFVR